MFCKFVNCTLTAFRSVEDLFAKARSEHMKSAQHHLKTAAELDDSEDEEDDIGSIILNGVFKSYANIFGKYTAINCLCVFVHSFFFFLNFR